MWTWTAIDADSKLMISRMVSDRNQEAADALIRDLKKRTFWCVPISTDGLPEYFNANPKTYRYGEAGEIIKTYASSKAVPVAHLADDAREASLAEIGEVLRRQRKAKR